MLKFVHPRSVKVMRFDGKAVDKELIRGVSAFFVTYILNLWHFSNGDQPRWQ